MGGETCRFNRIRCSVQGLSPRGRGNLLPSDNRSDRFRSIPAWAGKPSSRCRASRSAWVYPRVGGETSFSGVVREGHAGLSPRGRGNRHRSTCGRMARRSIPAWAGKPQNKTARQIEPTVYPRVGGETRYSADRRNAAQGLSPRGRGNRSGRFDQRRWRRSIPAWAGKPLNPPRDLVDRKVYPRVGGETPGFTWYAERPAGLSPRGRGNQKHLHIVPVTPGSIPAWAGKPWVRPAGTRRARVYPRVGGETGPDPRPRCVPPGLSPRGRGNPQGTLPVPIRSRSIPAWAGKPSSCAAAL